MGVGEVGPHVLCHIVHVCTTMPHHIHVCRTIPRPFPIDCGSGGIQHQHYPTISFIVFPFILLRGRPMAQRGCHFVPCLRLIKSRRQMIIVFHSVILRASSGVLLDYGPKVQEHRHMVQFRSASQNSRLEQNRQQDLGCRPSCGHRVQDSEWCGRCPARF